MKSIYAAPLQNEDFPDVAKLTEKLVKCVHCEKMVDRSLLEDHEVEFHWDVGFNTSLTSSPRSSNPSTSFKNSSPLPSTSSFGSKESRKPIFPVEDSSDDSEKTWPLLFDDGKEDESVCRALSIVEAIKGDQESRGQNVIEVKRLHFFEKADQLVENADFMYVYFPMYNIKSH